jgi:ATP-binding cassette subfamily B protein
MSLSLPISEAAQPIAKQPSTWRRFVELWRFTWRFGARHRRSLFLGLAFGVGVILIRLALPFMFKELLKPMLTGSSNHRQLARWIESGFIEQPLLFGWIFLLLLTALGLVDFLARLKFAEFAIGTVRDLRARAFQSAMQQDPDIRVHDAGEVVARLIGDTARVKEGLKGFLVHVATNGGLFVGASVVLLVINPLLGAILASAFALIGVITALGTWHVYARASKTRRKEGKLARSIHESLDSRDADSDFTVVNASSGHHEAAITRLQGRTTWVAHIVFGFAVLMVVWLGMRMVSARELSTPDMLLFIMYALMTRAPMVQLTRQGTRTGKILACLNRLEELMSTTGTSAGPADLPAMTRSLEVRQLRVVGSRSRGKHRRLSVPALSFAPGERVALVGKSGSGKSTLLNIIAGREFGKRGAVLLDDVDLATCSRSAREDRITMMSDPPAFGRQRLWQYLGLKDSTADETVTRAIRKLDLEAFMGRLPRGLETRLDAAALSTDERRAIGLLRAACGRHDVLLLDNPTGGLSRARSASRLKKLFKLRPAPAVIVVAAPKLPRKVHFDRVIKLRNGKIAFDGTVDEFNVWSAEQRAKREAQAAESTAVAVEGTQA